MDQNMFRFLAIRPPKSVIDLAEKAKDAQKDTAAAAPAPAPGTNDTGAVADQPKPGPSGKDEGSASKPKVTLAPPEVEFVRRDLARAAYSSSDPGRASGGWLAGLWERVFGPSVKPIPRTDAGTYKALSPQSREFLRKVGISDANFTHDGALAKLPTSAPPQTITDPQAPTTSGKLLLGAVAKPLLLGPEAKLKLGKQTAKLVGSPAASPSFYFSGVGHLEVVRKRLKAYELEEFSHIENVLAGELRLREHRRLRRVEEDTLQATETTRETERDLQSTERTALEREVKQEAQQSVKVDAGLNLAGKYGPSVDFTSSLNGGFAQQSTQSSRNSTSYSREVVDKAIERVKERVLEERRRRLVEETEELNRHEMQNQRGTEHVRGVYRCVNAIYEAQVYTYGRRAMFDFIVPEPAALYMSSFLTSANNIPIPVQPDFGPEEITRDTYLELVGRFRATAVPEPPQATVVATAVGSTAGTSPGYHAKADAVALPDGYEAVGVEVNFMVSAGSGGWSAWIEVDSNIFTLFHNTNGGRQDLLEYKPITYPAGKTISVAFQGFKITQYSYGVNIYCTPSLEAMQKWQLAVYERILDAYQRDRAEYEERIANAKQQLTAPGIGRNPGSNERIIRGELQRECISLLAARQLDTYDAFEAPAADQANDLPWRMDFPRARGLAVDVRFFQHAFEWENITFLFYGYFWGRSARWPWALHDVDEAGDPLFAEFLRAGAGRVQVPVRPGFEEAVFSFLETGNVDIAGSAQLAQGSAYLPIVQEIRAQTDDDLGGIAGDKWEITVPTSLVLLQDPGQVAFRDQLGIQAGNVEFGNPSASIDPAPTATATGATTTATTPEATTV